jgi:RNA polymerase sigma-70 factor, ECF subfamily
LSISNSLALSVGDEITLAAAGPPDAPARELEAVARQYQPVLQKVAYRLTGDRETARDLVQEAYLTYLESADAFRGGASLKTYLYRIVINKSLNEVKRRQRWFGFREVFTREKSNEDKGPGPALEADDLLRKLFRGLPAKYRLPLVLAEADGMPYEEIAGVLKISVNTVRTRIFRCREKLRDEYVKIGGVL